MNTEKLSKITANRYVSAIRKGIKYYKYEVYFGQVVIDNIKAKDEDDAKIKFAKIVADIYKALEE